MTFGGSVLGYRRIPRETKKLTKSSINHASFVPKKIKNVNGLRCLLKAMVRLTGAGWMKISRNAVVHREAKSVGPSIQTSEIHFKLKPLESDGNRQS